METLYLYFLTYLLTLSGFLLGKATKEEHDEIKITVQSISILLISSFYLILFYLFYNTKIFFILLLFLIIFLLSFKIKLFFPFHNILILALSFILLNSYYGGDYLAFILIMIFTMILFNSFKNFKFKEEIYSIILFGIIYVISSGFF
ncbi:MAG: hypothetical protein KC589_00275 [Nanoarchaeota archaeon]|nr:hypothetical protein [Nanoarchaeota archaeon]